MWKPGQSDPIIHQLKPTLPSTPWLGQLLLILFFFFNFCFLFVCLFIYLWLCWVFVSVQGLSLVVASGGHSSSRCAGFSLSWPLLLRSTGSRRAGSVIVAHGPSCSAACGNLPRPGLEPMSPALAGRFSTTAPPGKPPTHSSRFRGTAILSQKHFLTLPFKLVLLDVFSDSIL